MILSVVLSKMIFWWCNILFNLININDVIKITIFFILFLYRNTHVKWRIFPYNNIRSERKKGAGQRSFEFKLYMEFIELHCLIFSGKYGSMMFK